MLLLLTVRRLLKSKLSFALFNSVYCSFFSCEELPSYVNVIMNVEHDVSCIRCTQNSVRYAGDIEHTPCIYKDSNVFICNCFLYQLI